ncbi:leucine-rich repeat-containing protein [Naegleria gruberi]|uniref:Leucine-rich repeat-containing protein n=1 Tax=Naegleria gruberi TaxID=5762 RepID=D2VJH0_NAEGR|nr:leucine-rich repeat-containing protein [Naegleria gruberi]EFC43037.1 leucine-rich repeat-containing protein [Naegleria gruberi]|eukprot:XP_002675781.1 leucine-rich repeat-containing protein [Naegleria gruberi strain NEG-M]
MSYEEPATNLDRTVTATPAALSEASSAKEYASYPSDFLELYLQKCSDYSISTPVTRLLKEYNAVKEKGKEMRHLILNGNCVSMFEKRLHNLDIFPICDTLEILHTGFIVSCDLSYNNIGDSGANSIARMLKINSSIQHLSLRSNSISERGASDIADSLKENRNLLSFDFSYNAIEDKGGMKMADMLEENITLKFLNLSSCDLKTSSVIKLAISVRHHPSLQELRIGKTLCNSKKEESLQHLAEIFRVNTVIRSLDLSFQSISDSGINTFFQGIKLCRTLTHLRLGANCITMSVDVIAKYLENPNCAIQLLDLSANRIDSDGGIQIAKCLIKNKTLTYLDLSGNNIGDDSLTFLAKTLASKNEVLSKLFVAGNKFNQKSIKSFDDLAKERYDLDVDIHTYKTDDIFYCTKKTIPETHQYGDIDTLPEQISEIERILVRAYTDSGLPSTNLDSINN